ncbi:hypothetical protein FACS189459_6370 [Bacilli bacterium]|nr:hypothetical protein FACS189459_6370 [Bacilli bacterium]GHU52215.1 hypothetical protein FACS189496_1990 [Bacilli bacterium]
MSFHLIPLSLNLYQYLEKMEQLVDLVIEIAPLVQAAVVAAVAAAVVVVVVVAEAMKENLHHFQVWKNLKENIKILILHILIICMA